MKRFAGFAVGVIVAFVNYAFSLSVGDKAPDFTLTTANDSSFSLTQYQGQVRVLYFLCFSWELEQATGSAVDKFIWQVYKNHDVKVLGIETGNWPNDTLISRARQWEITFPIATGNTAVKTAYLRTNYSQSNTIFLIDKQGIVRAIADVIALVAGPVDPHADSAVQAVAGKIPALLAAAVWQRRIPLRGSADGVPGGEKLQWTGDLKGRRLDRAGAVKASQMVIDGAKSHRTFIRSK